MEFTKNLRFLGCRIGDIEINKVKESYYTCSFYDEESSTTFETGFIANKKTADMETFLTSAKFGDVFSCTLVLRKAEKDNRYKIGLRNVC